MATVNLGSIKFKWKGTYNGATAYTIDDVVEYNGSSYICISNSTGNLPTNATYFEQMSSAGTNGTDGTDLTTTLTTQGDIVYRDASGLARLGAGTSGQLLQSGGTGANVSWTDAPAGITEADQWRLNADFAGNSTDINTGWERNDKSSFDYIGTGMTESSGIFTFPSTGIYWVHFSSNVYAQGTDSIYHGIEAKVTTNNSSYATVANSYASSYSGSAHNVIVLNTFFDVTDTSTHKLKFGTLNSHQGTIAVLSNTNFNITQATFLRLGDT